MVSSIAGADLDRWAKAPQDDCANCGEPLLEGTTRCPGCNLWLCSRCGELCDECRVCREIKDGLIEHHCVRCDNRFTEVDGALCFDCNKFTCDACRDRIPHETTCAMYQRWENERRIAT